MENLRLFPELSLTNIIPALSGQLGSSANILSTIIAILVVFVVLLIVLFIIPTCLIFKKAGRSWWEALIPFYNLYVLLVITGIPWWVIFGFFIPVLNWIVPIYVYYQLSKRFGFDIPFAIGLIFLPFIFLPILAFGSAVYTPLENQTV